MEYVAIYTNEQDEQEQYIIDALDARTAHEAAAAMLDTTDIRIYPATDTNVGIMRGAIMVARRTAVNAVMRQGTPTQHKIERETAAISVRIIGADEVRINAVVAEYSADTQDFYSVAINGLYNARAAGLDIAEQYHEAFLALNHYINAQRAASDHELSTEYIQDGGGDIVAYNSAIACILRGGEKWTAADGANMDAATAARLGRAIMEAVKTITPTQRRICELLGRGISQREIARRTNRDVATINRNIAITRGKIAEYINANYPEFADMVKQDETAAAATAAANGGRTADGKQRHDEASKATQAERARRYRERKAAARAAANANNN